MGGNRDTFIIIRILGPLSKNFLCNASMVDRSSCLLYRGSGSPHQTQNLGSTFVVVPYERYHHMGMGIWGHTCESGCEDTAGLQV